MAYNPTEVLAGNQSINAALHKIISSFSEPSQGRMLRKIRSEWQAAQLQGTPEADASARHIFREFLVGHRLNQNGFNLQYSETIGGLTPDWYDPSNHLLVEVFTCERGGASDVVSRVVSRIREKADRYEAIVEQKLLHYVVAVHGDFESFFDLDDCERLVRESTVFAEHPHLSGIIYFGEPEVTSLAAGLAAAKLGQAYEFTYFRNPTASRDIDLSTRLGDSA